MLVVFYIFAFVFGCCLGSFLCCQARRLRLKEKGKKSLGKRSVCPFCKHKLGWYENIPIVSWLIQKGKCRKCGKKIGAAEILSELFTGLAVLGLTMSSFKTADDIASSSFFVWAVFATTLLLILSLIFSAIYDGLYGELPRICLIFSAICAIIIAILKLWNFFSVAGEFYWQPILELIGATMILGGIYLVLYLVSKGKWVGDGDWILGAIIAMALGTPWLALVTLFVSNFSACIIMYPKVLKKKNHTIYFGPFLVFAFILTLILSDYGIINL